MRFFVLHGFVFSLFMSTNYALPIHTILGFDLAAKSVKPLHPASEAGKGPETLNGCWG